MITDRHINQIKHRDVYGSDGERIGQAGVVYLDDQTGRPDWVSVNIGLFGMKESFVPLAQAEVTDQGVTVPYTKSHVKDAPNVDPDNGHLSLEEEQTLFQHYGLDYGQDRSTVGGNLTDAERHGDSRDLDDSDAAVGHDTSGPTTDDAMTRSEERLNVGTQQQEAGRARLRKYVVTEQQSVDVPVTREEVRVEREPITDENRDEALTGPDISEEEHEVTLREERPVVETEAVPVERVRLSKEEVTDQESVSGEVRKEQIETDGLDERR